MPSMQVLGEVKAPYPYTAPTRAFRVRIRERGKSQTFTVPTGAGGLPYGVHDVVRHLNELAIDAYILEDSGELEEMAGSLCDYEHPPTSEEYHMARALGKQGLEIRDCLEHLGLLDRD